MRRTMAVAMGALLLTGAAFPKGAEMDSRPRRTTDLPRPRDPNIAVQEELDVARRAGTVEAYDLFIARHGRDPLTRIARRERARILRTRQQD
jgi:hypothetical protein